MPTSDKFYRIVYNVNGKSTRIDVLDWKAAHVKLNRLRARGANDARILTIPTAR